MRSDRPMTNYADEIKRAVPATELFPFYGFTINRGGFVCCPLHGEKTASLKVYPGNKGWKCFGCGAGSSVIDFVMQYFNLSFLDAQKKINDDFRLGLPIGEKLSREQQLEADHKAAERRRQQKERENAYKRVLTAYHAALDRWVYLDILKRENAPKSPTEPFNDKYVYAVKRIDEAGYELDKATDRLRGVERREQ